MIERLINYKQHIMPRTPEQFKEIREKTRSTILEHALKLFASKGYHGTSINDIAKSAGISKGLAYNYFGSKKELAEAIINQLMELMVQLMGEVKTDATPIEILRDIISSTFDHITENEEFWRLYFNFIMQREILDISEPKIKDFSEKMFLYMEDLLREAGYADPVAESRILGAIIDGVTLHYYFDKENYPLDKVKGEILKRYGS